MVVHILDQPELDKGEGPIAIIVAPTRELAEQIHKEARRAAPQALGPCAPALCRVGSQCGDGCSCLGLARAGTYRVRGQVCDARARAS